MALRNVILTGSLNIETGSIGGETDAHVAQLIQDALINRGWSINFVTVQSPWYDLVSPWRSATITINSNVDSSYSGYDALADAMNVIQGIQTNYYTALGFTDVHNPFSNVALQIYSDPQVAGTHPATPTPTPTPPAGQTVINVEPGGNGNNNTSGGANSGGGLNLTELYCLMNPVACAAGGAVTGATKTGLAASLGITTPTLVIGGIAAALILIVVLDHK